MIQALVKKGKVFAEEVPAPLVSEGSLLIKVVNSCISAGTEMSGLQQSGKSLIKKVIQQPEKLNKLIDVVKNNGVIGTYAQFKNNIEKGVATGYSVSGVVIGIGKGVEGFMVGDCVAAAGAGIANHAEYVNVPANLVMKMPANMDFKLASTVTLGGIAMHGIRRASLNFGEFGVVMGAGILGLLSIQMFKLAGVRVIAIDLDNKRLEIAKEFGAELVINPNENDIVKCVENYTGGYGADAVLFTAATSSSEPLSQAFSMCKRKGKVILVGVVGMELKREDMYADELDFLISTSYGPGRYDTNYEKKGLDYPYAYVRWTENRNMTEYLRLVHSGEIKLDKLINSIFQISNVTEAFELLQNKESRPLMIILDYGTFDPISSKDYLLHDRRVQINKIKRSEKKIINIGMVGLGNFATGMHLPNISKLKNKFKVHALMSRTGHKAKHIAEQYKAAYATTNYDDLLNDVNVDLVFICTPHESHADLVLGALKAGKHVFVEKPLATTQHDLDKISTFYSGDSVKIKPVLMVGFNRRFSKFAREIKKHTDKRINPVFIHYRMNAGYAPLNNWVHEAGGRIVGEACHIIDLMTFFTGDVLSSISYESLSPANDKYSNSDNKSIVLKYNDGSVCTIEYFALGSKLFPKEYMEVHFDEKTIVMEDYKTLKSFGIKIDEMVSATSEKGQLNELEVLYDALKKENSKWPIELWDMIQSTAATFLIK